MENVRITNDSYVCNGPQLNIIARAPIQYKDYILPV